MKMIRKIVDVPPFTDKLSKKYYNLKKKHWF